MIPAFANHVPHLMIALDPSIAVVSAREARARLRTGTPAIEINPHTASSRSSQESISAQPNSLVVTTFLLNPGEEEIVGRQIRKVLTDPKSVGTYTPRPPKVIGEEE